ncbi:hypothetical protein LAUMK41_05690 [Mycobacterium attenuatum]|nr:hypothetical protein LAUMK41_05690 [Mycobacterium attenuatum]
MVRSDSAGATHAFAKACRDHHAGFSFGYPVDARVQDAVDTLNRGNAWYPAIEATGDIRGGAWVAEATGLVNLWLFRFSRGEAVWLWMALAVIGGCRPTVLGAVGFPVF